MEDIYRLLSAIPTVTLFYYGPRLQTPGMRWAPGTFLNQPNISTDESWDDTTGHKKPHTGRLTGHGLRVSLRAFMLIFTVTIPAVEKWYIEFLAHIGSRQVGASMTNSRCWTSDYTITNGDAAASGELESCALLLSPETVKRMDKYENIGQGVAVLVHDVQRAENGELFCKYAAAATIIAPVIDIDENNVTEDGDDLTDYIGFLTEELTWHID